MIHVWIYMGIISEFLVGMAIFYMGHEDIGSAMVAIAGVAAVVQMIREEVHSEKRRNKNV